MREVATIGLLQLFPIPQSIFYDITIDFVDILPKSKGKDVILLVVDKLTKYTCFIPLPHPYYACTTIFRSCQQAAWISIYKLLVIET